MRRRDFITGIAGSAAAWPFAARAQQPERKRVAFVIGLNDGAEAQSRFAAFRQGLEALGWVGGKNIEIVARFGTVDPDRNRTVVAELLKLAPGVIVTSNEVMVSALLKETRTIPIVLANMPDPIALGFAQSLARPGGNVTGFTSFEPVSATKWVELLKEVAPSVTRIAVLINQWEGGTIYNRAIEAAASVLGLHLTLAPIRDDADIADAIISFARQANGGLIVPPGAALGAARTLIVGLTARHRLPAVYSARDRVVAGGLMSYGPDVLDLYRRPASYVDRILKGANAADLPIQQPTKFELVINLKTAKALGLTVSDKLLVAADEVIE